MPTPGEIRREVESVPAESRYAIPQETSVKPEEQAGSQWLLCFWYEHSLGDLLPPKGSPLEDFMPFVLDFTAKYEEVLPPGMTKRIVRSIQAIKEAK